jgi:hypothetical protein
LEWESGYASHTKFQTGSVGILYGAVTWPHEQDIAPETLLAGMTPVQEAPLCS